MNRLQHTKMNALRRKMRVRKVVAGTQSRPRLSVFISNRNVTAQVINDDSGKTLAYVTTAQVKATESKSMTEKAIWVGAEVAKKAKTAKVSTVVFDRNGRLYHGKVKALADSARENGLEF